MSRNIILNIIKLIIVSALLPSCATIIGGSKYYAKVQVPEHPDAKIEYEGIQKGTGEASFKVDRRSANNFSVIIKKEGCETQTQTYRHRRFRGWAFTGSLLGWTFIAGGIPIPLGIIVDAGTGAWWKPDISEVGVSKQDYKHYTYKVNYTGCKNEISAPKVARLKTDMLKELKLLLDDGVLTEEEFVKEKKKILEGEN